MSSMVVRVVRRIEREVGVIRATAEADAFIASYPKAGRTWLRFILASYLNEVFRLGLQMDFRNLFRVIPNDGWDAERGLRAYGFGDRPEVPLLVASHSRYRRMVFKRKDVIFVARDPRDLMVSAYYHRTRHVRRFEGDIGSFLRDPRQGLADYVRHANGWARSLGRHRSLVIGYERLSTHTEEAVEEALRFVGLEPDRGALGRAVAASTFGRMQAIEVESGIPAHSYDRSDPNSLRVRRGAVGGFVDDLSPADVAYIERSLEAQLTPSAKALLASAGCWNPEAGKPVGACEPSGPRLAASAALLIGP
jgi:alcohol sulfotransferase